MKKHMDWWKKMRQLQGTKEKKINAAAAKAPFEGQGLAGWVFGQLRGLRSGREIHRRQMKLVETLSLGGKRQLMLVTCGAESFLVGGGMDCVETIVPLKAEHSLNCATTGLEA
jgi:hypothetical protein